MNLARNDRALRPRYSTSRSGKRAKAPGARLASTAIAVLLLATTAVTVTSQGMAYAIDRGPAATATVPADLAALVLPPPAPLREVACSYCGPFDLKQYSARGIGGGPQESAELTKAGFARGYLGGGLDKTDQYSGLVYAFGSPAGAEAYLAFSLSPSVDNEGTVPGTLEHFAVPGVAGARGFSVRLKGRAITSYYVYFARGRLVLLALDGGTGGEALSIQAAQLVSHRLSG